MKVKDIMSYPVYVVSPGDSVARARNLMLRHKVGCLLVMDGDEIAGIFTKSDLNKKLIDQNPSWKKRPIDTIPVSSVCTEDVFTISPNASVELAARIMAENKIDHLPVVEKEIYGVVSKTDLVRYATTIQMTSQVLDFATGKVVSANINHTINYILGEMEKNDVQKVVIMNNEKEAVGIVSIKDLSANYFSDIVNNRAYDPNSKRRSNSLFLPIVAEDVMTGITVVDAGDSVSNAAKKIYDNHFSSVPVTKNKKVVGLFTRDDIVTALSKEKDSEKSQ